MSKSKNLIPPPGIKKNRGEDNSKIFKKSLDNVAKYLPNNS